MSLTYPEPSLFTRADVYADNDWDQDKYRFEEDKYRVEDDVENFPENTANWAGNEVRSVMIQHSFPPPLFSPESYKSADTLCYRSAELNTTSTASITA